MDAKKNFNSPVILEGSLNSICYLRCLALGKKDRAGERELEDILSCCSAWVAAVVIRSDG